MLFEVAFNVILLSSIRADEVAAFEFPPRVDSDHALSASRSEAFVDNLGKAGMRPGVYNWRFLDTGWIEQLSRGAVQVALVVVALLVALQVTLPQRYR